MRKVLLICLAICFVLAISALAFDDMGKSATVKGWVADDKCGAKGANAKAEACTKKCLDAGAKMVVVTDGDQKILRGELVLKVWHDCFLAFVHRVKTPIIIKA